MVEQSPKGMYYAAPGCETATRWSKATTAAVNFDQLGGVRRREQAPPGSAIESSEIDPVGLSLIRARAQCISSEDRSRACSRSRLGHLLFARLDWSWRNPMIKVRC